MARLVLLDNDAALKLARYDLLDLALAALGCSRADVRVLPTARYKLLPAKNRLLYCKDEASADRFAGFLDQVQSIDTSRADPSIDTLVAVPGIDTGEAHLFALAAKEPAAIVVTGDKRGLRALSGEPDVGMVATALAGRVICAETLFRMMAGQDFRLTQTRVRAQSDVDKALASIFGISTAASRDSVTTGLESYERALRAETGTLLFQPP